MWERVTKTTKIEEVEDDLRELVKQRGRVRVLTVDNVPPVEKPEESAFVKKLLDIFKAEWICQDRFHVFHNISPEFNNQDPRYFPLVILSLRNLTTRREPTVEAELDLLLRKGMVQKKVTFGHTTFEVKLGQEMTQEQIEHWKEIGVYHEMFSKSPYAVVPEYVKSKPLLDEALSLWFDRIKEVCFTPEGAPIKDAIRGTYLIQSLCDLERIRDNGLLRMKACVPPTKELEDLAWFETGKVHNHLKVMRPRYHSCGNESWHSSQQDFIVGDHTSAAMATALYYEGITFQNSRSMRRMGEEDDLGHFDPERSLAVNRWAGHGDEAGDNPRLLAEPPHPKLLSRPQSTGETCVQDVAFTSGRKRRQLVAAPEGPIELLGPMPCAGPMQQPTPDIADLLHTRGHHGTEHAPVRRSPSRSRSRSPSRSRSRSPSPGSQSPLGRVYAAGLTRLEEAQQEEEEMEGQEAQSFSGGFGGAASSGGMSQASDMGAKRKSTQCKWMCICKDPSLSPSRGRVHHHHQCIRDRWIKGDRTIGEPTEGTQVTLLLASKQKYQYDSKRKQWFPVV